MNWLNRILALFLIGFSIIIISSSLRLGIGNVHKPGPGFMPFLVSILLLSLSFSVLIMGIKKSGVVGRKRSSTEEHLLRPIILLISLPAYIFLLEIFGYLIPTFLLIFLMLSLTDPLKWYKNIAIAFILTLTSFVLFHKGLRVQLPIGIYPIGW